MSTVDSSPFGRGLRHWRRIRGISQLDLATRAATTTRHLSFLETGRSRPSREMVERLGEALAVPLRERNRLLEMAGLAPSYPEGDLSTDDLAPFQLVIDRLLAAHDPFPGFVVDRRWDMVQANRGAQRFLADTTERNTVRLVLRELRPIIDNWGIVVAALVDRLAADLLRHPDDEVLQELHREALAATDRRRRADGQPLGRVICPRFRIDGTLIRTITVAARFESAADVTLDEVRVELLYPQDRTAEAYFRALS